jgi:HEAT repeat protein
MVQKSRYAHGGEMVKSVTTTQSRMAFVGVILVLVQCLAPAQLQSGAQLYPADLNEVGRSIVLRGALVGLLQLSLLPAYSLSVQGCQQQAATTAANSSPDKEKTGAENPGDAAWQILSDALADSDASKRSYAISAMSLLKPRSEVIGIVEGFLDDKDSAVRQAAVVTLGEWRSRRSLPKLRRVLDDDAAEVSFTAARILWEMGDTRGRLVLIQVLGGERGASGNLAPEKIREMKKKLHNPQALALFGVKQAGVLGPFGIGISIAEELRKDRSASARVLSADALATDNDLSSAEQLEDALTDKSWTVRAAATQALAKRGYRHSVPIMTKLLSDKHDVVRYTAAAAIMRLTHARYSRKPVNRD